MVPPCSDRITRVPPYSRIFVISTRTGLSPCIAAFSKAFRFLNEDHWPDPLSLATTHGVSVDVLSSGYMRCFSSPGLLPWPMDSAKNNPCGLGCPIRRSRDRRSLASPPGLSQRATSFIASQCQGIHQMPLLALERHTQRQESHRVKPKLHRRRHAIESSKTLRRHIDGTHQ